MSVFTWLVLAPFAILILLAFGMLYHNLTSAPKRQEMDWGS